MSIEHLLRLKVKQQKELGLDTGDGRVGREKEKDRRAPAVAGGWHNLHCLYGI